MEWFIYCTYWYFGTYKTLWNVALIKKKLDAWEIVFSNIKINKNYFNNSENYFYFDDIRVLHDVLAFSWIFARKVSEYNELQWAKNMPSFDRSSRPKVNIIFDELAVFADSSKYKEFAKEVWEDLAKYLVQIRKLWVWLYLIIQKPNKLVKELRQYVEYWIKPTPKFSFFQKYIIQYDLVSLDQETFKIDTELITTININGDVIQYEKQIRKKYFDVWFTPYYFNFYDDTYLNLNIDNIYFKTDYLKSVWIFNKILNNHINHKILTDNYKIYENFKNFLYDDKFSIEINKNFKRPSFFINPFYYFYLLIEFWKYFFRNPFKNTFIYVKIFIIYLIKIILKK